MVDEIESVCERKRQRMRETGRRVRQPSIIIGRHVSILNNLLSVGCPNV